MRSPRLSISTCARARRACSALASLGAVALLASGCGSSSTSPSSGGSKSAQSAGDSHGSVAVLYAGSLVNLAESTLGPRFQHATGYSFEGFPGGSEALAQQVKGKVRRGDVFVSASPGPDQSLMGSAGGGWVSWYASFATSPLLIAYDPRSSFAKQLRSEPWWKVVTEPGFKLGRTDPKLDPKGALIVKALDQAASEHHDPALRKLAEGTEGVFPEEALVGRLQSGQLDAGFFYGVEADAVKPRLPTVSIAPIDLAATYTVTVLRGAPNEAGAISFVKYLLGEEAGSALAAAGLRRTTPAVSGSRSGVPEGLRRALGLSP